MVFFVYKEVSIIVVDFMARLHHDLECFIRISRRDICRHCHGTQGHSRTSIRLSECNLSVSLVPGACESDCFHIELCFLV